jgi:ATP-binding cassette subfamily B multidrug efflux pump
MDRLIVLDEGRIVEQGTHAELIAMGAERGHYAKLWAHQSGGFLAEAVPEEDVQEEGPLDEMRSAERPEPDVDVEPAPVKV